MIRPTQLWSQIVRFGFRLLYNELAWSYDAVSWVVSLGAWNEWQRAALPYVRGPRVLEIGHGPGHMLLALSEAGHAVTGLDVSPFMGHLARKRLDQARMAVPLVRARVQLLPFPSAFFDTVLATFPTEFIVDPRTLTAVHRVLRPGGRLVIVPEGHLTGQGFIPRSIEALYAITGQRSGLFRPPSDASKTDSTNHEAFSQRFLENGFQVDIIHKQLASSGVTVVIARK